jgi:glycosyltransferase involved in cell wall biosynthesis
MTRDEIPAAAEHYPKVLFLADYGGAYGGNFIATATLLKRVYKGSSENILLALPQRAQSKAWAETLSKDGIPINIIPEKGMISDFKSIFKILWKQRIQLVHTHFTRFDITAWLAARFVSLLQGRSIRVIWHIHSDFPVKPSLSRRLKDFIKFRLMSAETFICTVSEHLNERPLLAGFDQASIFTIKNGIDFSRLKRSEFGRNPFAHICDKRRTIVLMYGWHPAIKGVDVALEAFERLARLRDDVALAVVGQDQTVKAVRERYPQGQPPWLFVVPPIETIADYLANASIFLSASRREGFPYSVIEALSCGCLVVASDIPALQWMKSSIQYGCFVNGKPDDLVARLVEWLRLPETERRQTGKTNEIYVRRHFSADHWTLEMEWLYKRVAGRGERTA